jgi:hypothetical protein
VGKVGKGRRQPVEAPQKVLLFKVYFLRANLIGAPLASAGWTACIRSLASAGLK